MLEIKDFDIAFKGLSLGSHTFDYELDDTFFELFAYDELNHFDLKAEVVLLKTERLLTLSFHVKGHVQAICDVSAEPFKLPLERSFELHVKFGPEENKEDDELWILHEDEYRVNIAQILYEEMVLAIPAKRIHPDVENGSMENEIMKKLKEQQTKKNTAIDPRWDKLKDLLN